MFDGFQRLDVDAGQFAGKQLGGAGAELRLLMDQHCGLGHATSGLVDLAQGHDGIVYTGTKTGL